MNYKHDQGRTLSVVTRLSLLNFMTAHRAWGLEYHPRERDLPRKSFGIYICRFHVWTIQILYTCVDSHLLYIHNKRRTRACFSQKL